MPRTRQQLETDLDLIEQAEEIVWVMLEASPPSTMSFPEIPADVPFDDQGPWQEQKRRETMQPRIAAVAPVLAKLAELRPRLRRLAHRHLAGPRAMPRYCGLALAVVTPSSPAYVCSWGCCQLGLDGVLDAISGCCEAVLDELRQMREGVQGGFATAPSGGEPTRQRDPAVFTKAGKYRDAVRKVLSVLPAEGEKATPRTLHKIAQDAHVSVDTIQHLSKPMQDEGLIFCDVDGVWRRRVAKPDP
jgi:hypothetical protein